MDLRKPVDLRWLVAIIARRLLQPAHFLAYHDAAESKWCAYRAEAPSRATALQHVCATYVWAVTHYIWPIQT